MQFGDTFVLTHLWIVISDPAKHSGNFLIANLTTNVARAGTDCELNQGDHTWITHKCFVSFADAREVFPKEELKIITLMAAGNIKKHFPMEPKILQRIVTSAGKSKALRIEYKKYF
jgi:hypothetical protein